MLSEYGKSNIVVGYEELQAITGYKTQTEVVACLIRQDIKFHTGKRGKPWTTLGAIELAMNATAIQQVQTQGPPAKIIV